MGTQMAQSTKECSSVTGKTAKAPTLGLTATSTKETTSMESKTEMELSHGPMAADTRACGRPEKGVGLAFTLLSTDSHSKWSERPGQKQQNLRVEDILTDSGRNGPRRRIDMSSIAQNLT